MGIGTTLVISAECTDKIKFTLSVLKLIGSECIRRLRDSPKKGKGKKGLMAQAENASSSDQRGDPLCDQRGSSKLAN